MFWTSKLLLASASKMLEEALSSSHPESCLVVPDLSKHDLRQFYSAAFTGGLEDTERLRSISSVASTLALHHLQTWQEEEEEEEEEEEDVSGGVKRLQKSDKIKLSHYFQHCPDSGPASSSLETQLKPFTAIPADCPDCGRKFPGSAGLDQHRARVHLRHRLGHSHWSRSLETLCSDWLEHAPALLCYKDTLKRQAMPLVGSFRCLELCRYGIRELRASATPRTWSGPV